MLKNKTVIVTAGNRGGGLALSKKYADNGANVVMIAEKIDEIASHPFSSENVIVIAIDFMDEQQINDVVKKTVERFGGVDILINNYSKFNFKNVIDTTPEMFRNVMNNVFATFFFQKHARLI